MNKEIINYNDIWYQVHYKWEANKSFLEFVAYKIESMIEKEGNDIPYEVSKDESLNGDIKFDGCMNVIMEKGYAHFCGRSQSNQYGKLFDKIYDKAKEIGCDDN